MNIANVGMNPVTNEPLMFSDDAGQLLQQLANNFQTENRRSDINNTFMILISFIFCRQQHKQYAGSSSHSSHGYHEPKPDPVLWFPGGDADCGSNAGSKYKFYLFYFNLKIMEKFCIIWFS